ncbi:MAG: phosphatidylserine decarboxylase [Pseudonocardiales bacterium]|nr:phosphatidylserine decarboxylase [Pseudonocardiales bacterium]MBV9031800.1 phosphatidylserine decarboxylase [Pseudonocardiales bacterium]MBW0009587.1 phosphatidylserine decarboxylase [Pseudonocardiales bacterium]
MASPPFPATLRHLVDLARETLPPMHPAGKPFVAAGAAATLLLRGLSPTAGTLSALATVCCAAFFREPHRVPPRDPELALAPADGTVSSVTSASAPAELGLESRPQPRVSVFLSLFDVHVQRIPMDGEIRRVAYRPGRFLTADLDKASADNERASVLLRSSAGHDLVVVQIAGLVARRIVCSVRPGDVVAAGATYGLIRFGSRVDLYLPPGSAPLVHPGQRTVGGETALARLPAAGQS